MTPQRQTEHWDSSRIREPTKTPRCYAPDPDVRLGKRPGERGDHGWYRRGRANDGDGLNSVFPNGAVFVFQRAEQVGYRGFVSDLAKDYSSAGPAIRAMIMQRTDK